MCLFVVHKLVRKDESLGPYYPKQFTVKASNENEAVNMVAKQIENDGYEYSLFGIDVKKVLTS